MTLSPDALVPELVEALRKMVELANGGLEAEHGERCESYRLFHECPNTKHHTDYYPEWAEEAAKIDAARVLLTRIEGTATGSHIDGK
jgi:hypothetical protein